MLLIIEMLKTTPAIMLHCNELSSGSEYVQGKYHVCTFVLNDCDFTNVCTYDSTIIKFPQELHLSETCHSGLENTLLMFSLYNVKYLYDNCHISTFFPSRETSFSDRWLYVRIVSEVWFWFSAE